MRITLNISDSIIAETQTLYGSKNRSNAVEQALKDAIRYKKLQNLFALKGKIIFDEEYLVEQRRAEVTRARHFKQVPGLCVMDLWNVMFVIMISES